MDFWRKEQIDNFIIEISQYYQDCTATYFENQNLPTKLNKEELKYLNENLNLGEIVGVENHLVFNAILKDNSKNNFSFYLLRTKEIDCEVNSLDAIKSTVFIELSKRYLESNNFLLRYLFSDLFERGYKIKNEDDQFLLGLYKDKKIKDFSDFDRWIDLRFAVKLKKSKMYEVALANKREFYTLLSIKEGKPYSFNFPNLLGVVINAIQNYRENGDIILKAIKVFNQTSKIQKLDLKKGTFKRKVDEYLHNKPIQNEKFTEVAEILFPELQ